MNRWKIKNIKKKICLLLTLSMLLETGVPVFAAENVSGEEIRTGVENASDETTGTEVSGETIRTGVEDAAENPGNVAVSDQETGTETVSGNMDETEPGKADAVSDDEAGTISENEGTVSGGVAGSETVSENAEEAAGETELPDPPFFEDTGEFSAIDVRAKEFTVSVNVSHISTNGLRIVAVEKNGFMPVDKVSASEILSANWISFPGLKPMESITFGGVNKVVSWNGSWKTGLDVSSNTAYTIYAATFSDNRVTSKTVRVAEVTTKKFGTVKVQLESPGDVTFSARELSFNLIPKMKDRIRVIDSRDSRDVTETFRDKIEYRYTVSKDNIGVLSNTSGGTSVPSADGTVIKDPTKEHSKTQAVGKYYLAAYVSGLPKTDYEHEVVSSNTIETFNIVSANANFYPEIKAQGNIRSEDGEFRIEAGKSISYGDIGYKVILDDGSSAPADLILPGKVAYILTQNGRTKVLIPEDTSKTVSFDEAGYVTIMVSQNGASVPANYVFVGKTNDDKNRLNVMKPRLSLTVSCAEIPYGYVTNELAGFDIRRFIRVTDEAEGGADVTRSGGIIIKFSLSSDKSLPAYSNSIANGKVGEDVYVYAEYTRNPSVSANLTSGLKIGKQKVVAVPEPQKTVFSVDPKKSVSQMSVAKILLIDEKGRTGATLTGEGIKNYIKEKVKLSFLPADRDSCNKYQYTKIPLSIPATGVFVPEKKEDSYILTVSACDYTILPTVKLNAPQLQKFTEDRPRLNEDGSLKTENYTIFTGLSENDIKAWVDREYGSGTYADPSTRLMLQIRAVQDGSETERGIYNNEINYQLSMNKAHFNKSHYLVIDSIPGDVVDPEYVSDIHISFFAREQKYEAGITELYMEPIDAVPFTGFSHIAKQAGSTAGSTADLEIHVYSKGRELQYGKDYTVSYRNNLSCCDIGVVGETGKWPAAVINGCGSYKGMSFTEYFSINRAPVNTIAEVGLKEYYKVDKKGNFTIAPKFVTRQLDKNGKWVTKEVKENITWYAIKADSEKGLNETEKYLVHTKKGNYTGSTGLELRLVIEVNSGDANFRPGKYLADRTFYVLPTNSKKISAKFINTAAANIEWKNVKDIDEKTGLRRVDTEDFAGELNDSRYQNLSVYSGKDLTVPAGDYTLSLFSDKKGNRAGVSSDGFSTVNVGRYYLGITPVKEAVLKKGFLPDTVYLTVNYKTDQKLKNVLKNPGIFAEGRTEIRPGVVSADKPDKNGNLTVEIVNCGTGFEISLNAAKGLKNEIGCEAYDLLGKAFEGTDLLRVSKDSGTVINRGFSASNASPGTYKVTFIGSGAYMNNDRVTVTYKVAAFRADKVRIRVIPEKGKDTVPYNAGGYVYGVYVTPDNGREAYDTDIYGHVNLELQTKKGDVWVKNDYLTELLPNASVSVKNKQGVVQVRVTNLLDKRGQAAVTGTIRAMEENVKIESRLGNDKGGLNDSLYVENKGLTEKNVFKAGSMLPLMQYSAAKGIDYDGDYVAVPLKLNRDYRFFANHLEVGMISNSVTFMPEGIYFTGRPVTISNNGGAEDDEALAMGTDSYTAGKFKITSKAITNGAAGLNYRKGLKVLPESVTLEGYYETIVLKRSENFTKVVSDNDSGYRVRVVFDNNRDISGSALATVEFIPIKRAYTAYIGKKTVKFRIR